MGCVYLVDIVAPGRGEAFEEEHEEDVLIAAIKEIITLLFFFYIRTTKRVQAHSSSLGTTD